MRSNILWFTSLAAASGMPSTPARTILSNVGQELTSSDTKIITMPPQATVPIVPTSLYRVDDNLVSNSITMSSQATVSVAPTSLQVVKDRSEGADCSKCSDDSEDDDSEEDDHSEDDGNSEEDDEDDEDDDSEEENGSGEDEDPKVDKDPEVDDKPKVDDSPKGKQGTGTKKCDVQLEALKMLYAMKLDEIRKLEDDVRRITKLYDEEKTKGDGSDKRYETCNKERKALESKVQGMEKQLGNERDTNRRRHESCVKEIVNAEHKASEMAKKAKALEEEIEKGPGPFPCNPEEKVCQGENREYCARMGCCGY